MPDRRPVKTMEPAITTIKEAIDIHVIFRFTRSHHGMRLFRGQTNADWPLIPKAGRPEYFLSDLDNRDEPLRFRDLGRFRAWRERTYPFTPDIPPSDYDALAYAQHHGLATRLLDWTLNPLVATYFAVRGNRESDGAVFCYSSHGMMDPSKSALPIPGTENADVWTSNYKKASSDPEIEEQMESTIDSLHGRAVITRAFDARMLNQQGAFTVHWPPNRPILVGPDPVISDAPNLTVIRIPAAVKNEMRNHLDDYGISEAFIFPDSDGVAAHVNWETTNMIERTAARNRRD